MFPVCPGVRFAARRREQGARKLKKWGKEKAIDQLRPAERQKEPETLAWNESSSVYTICMLLCSHILMSHCPCVPISLECLTCVHLYPFEKPWKHIMESHPQTSSHYLSFRINCKENRCPSRACDRLLTQWFLHKYARGCFFSASLNSLSSLKEKQTQIGKKRFLHHFLYVCTVQPLRAGGV